MQDHEDVLVGYTSNELGWGEHDEDVVGPAPFSFNMLDIRSLFGHCIYYTKS